MTDPEIEAVEARLRAAMLANDVAELDALIDADLFFTSIEGTIATKQMDLDAHRAGQVLMHTVELSDVHMHRYGDTAVVAVRMDATGEYLGQPFAGAYRYTRVWARRPDGWRIVAGHMSTVPE
jgi:ketosteroid isomerase-like protein